MENEEEKNKKKKKEKNQLQEMSCTFEQLNQKYIKKSIENTSVTLQIRLPGQLGFETHRFV